MSAKKQLTNKKSSSDKKATDKKTKKTAVAEKASSAKKPVAKSSAAKKTTKTVVKKSPAVASKTVKSTKKAEAPKVTKSAPKSNVKKETKKVVEQKKTVVAGNKNIAQKALKNAGPKNVSDKSSKKTPPKVTKPQGGSKPSDSAVVGKEVVKKPTPSPVPSPKPEEVKAVSKGETEISRNAPVLLSGGIKLAKVAFFFEALEQDDHSSKKKSSSSGAETVEKPTASKRHRASIGEETTEEIYARVVAELQEENLRFMQECSNQLCTKCCRNPVAPEFRVDKDLGYCEECAEILGLGHSKEARHLNYQLTRLGADALDEARDDDDFGEAPSQQELEEADKDFLEDDSI